MINPFETIDRRLSAIEEVLQELRRGSTVPSVITDAEPFGDFHWLRGTCPSIPASTLRIKSAAGEIPGVIKVGKRVLYEKSVVLDWLRNQTPQRTNTVSVNLATVEQFNRQLAKKGGSRA